MADRLLPFGSGHDRDDRHLSHPAVYEATTRIEIDRENTNFLPFGGNDPYDLYQDLEDYIETQSKILVSETLGMQTVKSLNLDQDPRFGGQPLKPGTLPIAAPSDGLVSPPPALGAFLGGLSVKRVPNSRLLDVTFATTDPKLAALIVNTHVNNFIEQNFRSRYEATTQASNWLANQLDELKAKVEASEDARIKYERDNQIWTLDEKQDVTTQKLADLNRDLTEAQADRISKEAIYQLAEAGNYDALPAVRESPVLQDSLKRQADLSEQYTEALNQYGPKFPKVVRLEAQLKDIQSLIENEKKNIGNQLEAEYRGSRQREVLLQQALAQQKNDTAAMADKMVQYNILKREAEANKQLYDGLLQKLKEAGISRGIAFQQHSYRRSGPGAHGSLSSEQVAQYHAGNSGWPRRRRRARSAARISRQYGQEPGRCGDLIPPAVSRRCAGIYRYQRGSPEPAAEAPARLR